MSFAEALRSLLDAAELEAKWRVWLVGKEAPQSYDAFLSNPENREYMRRLNVHRVR